MAGEWIKVEKATPNKPEVLKMARMLGINRDGVFGKWVRLWSWFDSNTVDGGVDGVVGADVDAIVEQDGFAKAAVVVGWLSVDEELERVSIPNFETHNGESAKKRVLKTQRQKRWRDSSTDATTAPSTDAPTREEKRREDSKGISIPPALAKESKFVDAFNMFAAHVGNKTGRPLDQIRADVILMKCTARGPEKAASDLLWSIEKDSTNLLDEKDDFTKHRGKNGKPESPRPTTGGIQFYFEKEKPDVSP